MYTPCIHIYIHTLWTKMAYRNIHHVDITWYISVYSYMYTYIVMCTCVSAHIYVCRYRRSVYIYFHTIYIYIWIIFSQCFPSMIDVSCDDSTLPTKGAQDANGTCREAPLRAPLGGESLMRCTHISKLLCILVIYSKCVVITLMKPVRCRMNLAQTLTSPYVLFL